jgi:hypothetical protein
MAKGMQRAAYGARDLAIVLNVIGDDFGDDVTYTAASDFAVFMREHAALTEIILRIKRARGAASARLLPDATS